ncbi:MAG: hypothetical protein WAV27_20430 [Xanthobacteraceae bacterium]
MRMMMKVQLPTADGNRAIKDGSLPEIIRKTLETAKAEAAYFTTMDGLRTMIAVFDLKLTPDIVRIAEPLFMGINATVEFVPCMNAEELKSGLSSL